MCCHACAAVNANDSHLQVYGYVALLQQIKINIKEKTTIQVTSTVGGESGASSDSCGGESCRNLDLFNLENIIIPRRDAP